MLYAYLLSELEKLHQELEAVLVDALLLLVKYLLKGLLLILERLAVDLEAGLFTLFEDTVDKLELVLMVQDGSLCELDEHLVVDVEQVMGVGLRVLEHFAGEGPLGPVGELEGFVGVLLAVFGEEVLVAALGELELFGGVEGVEEVEDVEAEVALEPEHVALGSVEHFGDFGVGQDYVEHFAEVAPEGEGVDDVVF